MPTLKDSAANRYADIDVSEDEQIRVTYVAHQDWTNGPTVRVQQRTYTGRVSPGPDFPASKADGRIAAANTLVGA